MKLDKKDSPRLCLRPADKGERQLGSLGIPSKALCFRYRGVEKSGSVSEWLDNFMRLMLLQTSLAAIQSCGVPRLLCLSAASARKHGDAQSPQSGLKDDC